eukprot:6604677-Pyramimonas_sp.AAC.1
MCCSERESGTAWSRPPRGGTVSWSMRESMCCSERESGTAWSRPPGDGVGELVDAGVDVLLGAGVGNRLVQTSWGR